MSCDREIGHVVSCDREIGHVLSCDRDVYHVIDSVVIETMQCHVTEMMK